MGKQLKQAKSQSKGRSIKVEENTEPKEEPVIKREQGEEKNTKENKSHERSKGKKNRLIIRNLVFDVREKHIRKLLTPFGELVDIQVPLNPNNDKLNKGFAFVEFEKYRSCEKAIKELNQTNFKGRPIVIDFSLAKTKFMAERLKEEDNVDQAEKQKQEDNQQDNEEDHQSQQKEEEVPEEKHEPQNKEQDLSRTIFVRNVPTSADQQTLKEFFSRYGLVKWAKVVIDKETNTPRGTAFIKYVNHDNAKKLIEYSHNYELFLTGKNPHFKRDPKYNLQLDGTIVKVFPVEKRQSIEEKQKDRNQAEQRKAKKLKPLKKIKKLKDLILYDKQGKRNIALAQLGFWEPQENMSEFYQERFRRHAQEKVQKLKNPNNSVSDKRVVLKYLNKSLSEEQIRDVAYDFLESNKLPKKELTYCKLMLDKQRKKSAGYSFLEFQHPNNAKMFVEQLANNMEALSSDPYVVEFALQDSRKLRKLKNKS